MRCSVFRRACIGNDRNSYSCTPPLATTLVSVPTLDDSSAKPKGKLDASNAENRQLFGSMSAKHEDALDIASSARTSDE